MPNPLTIFAVGFARDGNFFVIITVFIAFVASHLKCCLRLAFTVFRLSNQVIQDTNSPPWKDNDKCVLYGLSTGEEAFATAQERYLAQLRGVKENANVALACDLIAPAPAVQQLMDTKATTAAVDIPETSLAAPRSARKTTTAASFFGKQKTDKCSSDSQSKLSMNKASAGKKTTSHPATVTSMFQRAASSTSSTTSSSKPKAEEKENNKRTKAIGNADDFVGDEEESEDEEEAPVQKPAVVRERARPSADDLVLMDEDREDNEPVHSNAKATVYGAMDDFAKPKEPAAATDEEPKRRRRRKRLVDKTTMDEHGYLHTETQEIWEDIPSDEERAEEEAKKAKAPASIRPKKKVVKASGMKQGSLMGFFKKK